MDLQRNFAAEWGTDDAAAGVGERVQPDDPFLRLDLAIQEAAPYLLLPRKVHAVVEEAAGAELELHHRDDAAFRAPPQSDPLGLAPAFPHKIARRGEAAADRQHVVHVILLPFPRRLGFP